MVGSLPQAPRAVVELAAAEEAAAAAAEAQAVVSHELLIDSVHTLKDRTQQVQPTVVLPLLLRLLLR